MDEYSNIRLFNLLTRIPHSPLEQRLKIFLHRCFLIKNGNPRHEYLVLSKNMFYFLRKRIATSQLSIFIAGLFPSIFWFSRAYPELDVYVLILISVMEWFSWDSSSFHTNWLDFHCLILQSCLGFFCPNFCLFKELRIFLDHTPWFVLSFKSEEFIWVLGWS